MTEYTESGYYLWTFTDRDERVYDFKKEDMNFDKSVDLREEDVESVTPLYIESGSKSSTKDATVEGDTK